MMNMIVLFLVALVYVYECTLQRIYFVSIISWFTFPVLRMVSVIRLFINYYFHYVFALFALGLSLICANSYGKYVLSHVAGRMSA